jgi:hypothetical protein
MRSCERRGLETPRLTNRSKRVSKAAAPGGTARGARRGGVMCRQSQAVPQRTHATAAPEATGWLHTSKSQAANHDPTRWVGGCFALRSELHHRPETLVLDGESFKPKKPTVRDVAYPEATRIMGAAAAAVAPCVLGAAAAGQRGKASSRRPARRTPPTGSPRRRASSPCRAGPRPGAAPAA